MRFGAALDLSQLSASPGNPASGHSKLYIDAVGLPHVLDSGGADLPMAALLFSRKTADTTRNNTSTLANDPHLAVTLAANATYLINMFLIYTSVTTTPDLKIAFTAPAGAAFTWAPLGLDPSVTAVQGIVRYPAETTSNRTVATIAGVDTVATPTGIVRTAGTAGALTVQWSQNTQTAENTTVKTDSYLLAIRVA